MIRNVIVKVPTKEDWIKVVKQAVEDGCEDEGDNKVERWDTYKKKSCINLDIKGDGDDRVMYCNEQWLRHKYPKVPVLTTQEYLNKFNDGLVSTVDLIFSGETISQKKTIMNKITSSIKRIFNAKLQKQYKAGLIDNWGNLTHSGKEELDGIIRDKYVDEFTAIAEEIIKEAKEDK